MIEFIPLGMLAAVPVGVGFFFLARRKGRSKSAWGISMWVLAAVWLAGAAALPSMAGDARDQAAAMPFVFLMAGCFLLQLVLFFSLLFASRPGSGADTASKKRIVILLAILGFIIGFSVVFAFVL